MIGKLLTGAAVVTVGYALYRYARRLDADNLETFQQTVVKDAADWLAVQLQKPTEELEGNLRKVIANGEREPGMEKLVRLEYEVEKESPTHIVRTVLVALHLGDQVLVGRIPRQIRWEYVPEPLRAGFIRNGSEKQTFVLIDRAAAA